MTPLSDFEKRELLIKEQINYADPIWGEQAFVYDTFASGWVVISNRTGTYFATPGLVEAVATWSTFDKAKLTTWIVDQNRMGNTYPRIGYQTFQKIQAARPLRYSAKIDRFFLYLAHIGYRPGEAIIPKSVGETPETTATRHTIMRWTEAASEAEFHGLMAALISEGLVVEHQQRPQLTGKGLARLDDIDAVSSGSDQAFVAMWFDASTESVYEEGIAPGIQAAGYRPFRIDRKEHSNKIDDEIVAEIRRSRFLVADFTCGVVQDGEKTTAIARGGVYYEAGFAQGLGLPVIWSVREDQIGLVHFDTRQFNHITWKDAADFGKRLQNRIEATIGRYEGLR